MPRTHTGGERTLLAGDHNTYVKVEVKDRLGAWQDLSSYFIDARWTRHVDQMVMSGTVTLLRDVGGVSIAPTMTASSLNNIGGTFQPLVDGGRAIRISTSQVAVGAAVSTYREVFFGRIDNPEWGGDENTIVLGVSDLGAWLAGTIIQVERTYSNSTGVAVETIMQSILTDNINSVLGAVTLYVPSATGLVIRTYSQAKVSVLEALNALAAQAGAVVRYQYDASDVFRLTLIKPPRTKTTPDDAFGPSEYYAIPQLQKNSDDVRTKGKVFFRDFATGNILSATATAPAPALAQYGDGAYIEVREDVASNIDTLAEAQVMVDAMISDLDDAFAQHVMETAFFPIAELYDLYTYALNSVHYDAAQSLGVASIAHALTPQGDSTTITGRGKVTGFYKGWLVVHDTEPPATGTVGPSLDVRATPGSTTYSIAYTPATGVQLSIDGGAYSAAPASPIVVTRPAAGVNGKEYSFQQTLNGQTITDTIFVPAIDQDTVTPDLSVIAGTTTNTTVQFTPNASNPQSGGPVPTITISPKGTSASSAGGAVVYADGTTTAVTGGTLVTVNRPVFGTAVQATVTFRATISGAGAEQIARTLLNQVSLGPSLEVTPTPGSTSYSLAYTYSGTISLSIDGGAYGAPAASPITVTRNTEGGDDKVYSFKCVLDGQTIIQAITIPAQVSVPLSVSLGINACLASDAGATGPPWNQLEIAWTATGMPAGTTYDVGYNNGVSGGLDSQTGLSGSPATFTGVTFAGSPGKGAVMVTAKANGVTIATALKNKIYVT